MLTAPHGGSRAASAPAVRSRTRRQRARTSLVAQGEPMIWLTGGALTLCVLMIVGLLALVLSFGMSTFWPLRVERFTTADGRVFMGEVTRSETFVPQGEAPEAERERYLVRTGNYRITQSHFSWIDGGAVERRDRPEWALVVERLEWGRFYGFPQAFTRIEYLDAEGLSPAERLERARQRLRAFRPELGGEPRLVVDTGGAGDAREALLEPAALEAGGEPLPRVVGVAEVLTGPAGAWQGYRQFHDDVRARWERRRELEKDDTGRINRIEERARLAVRERELELEQLRGAKGSPEWLAAQQRLEAERARYAGVQQEIEREFDAIRAEIDAINRENARYRLALETSGEGHAPPVGVLMRLDEITRAYPANRLTPVDQLGVYLSRWVEYLTQEPREANSEGGVQPAIFGTVAMTLIMALAVVPFGVLAALYLREYARAGFAVSAVRIAVNNLAGVPSIVFGVFGLGFFCYVIGASIDELFFAAALPNPTYGKGGLLWASLTLALLTLPVVIVATEEALAAVPNSMREGSYACGASKWQTIRRIVLPRAMPGIMTGMILAMARGAGEVAPLMLVGAVKLASDLPVDGVPPYVHPDRSFMHLGFHIFDVGFQSQNSEAAKPMVYTTTLLLISIVACLNLAAIWIRKRLGRKFASTHL